jgi:hypothetical protein
MTTLEKIKKLTRQLYPTGRAFRMKEGGILDKLHAALAQSEARAWDDAISILDSTLPDNMNFTADDATAWERRLGLVTNGAVPLADRKAAILRKYNHPGTVPARNNWRFVEKQLRDAGFDVYIFENRFSDGMGGYVTVNPLTLTGGAGAVSVQHGQIQHGQAQHGGGYGHKVANSIYRSIDAYFATGTNLKSTFFIGGPYVGTFANVDADRETEFRQLILRAKPVQTVAFLFINYI